MQKIFLPLWLWTFDWETLGILEPWKAYKWIDSHVYVVFQHHWFWKCNIVYQALCIRRALGSAFCPLLFEQLDEDIYVNGHIRQMQNKKRRRMNAIPIILSPQRYHKNDRLLAYTHRLVEIGSSWFDWYLWIGLPLSNMSIDGCSVVDRWLLCGR